MFLIEFLQTYVLFMFRFQPKSPSAFELDAKWENSYFQIQKSAFQSGISLLQLHKHNRLYKIGLQKKNRKENTLARYVSYYQYRKELNLTGKKSFLLNIISHLSSELKEFINKDNNQISKINQIFETLLFNFNLSYSGNTNYSMTSKRQDKKNKKVKVACLHGYGTNKQFMKMQTQALRKDFEDIVQFIFLDAPHIIPIGFVMDPKVIKNLQGQPRSWIDWRVGHKTRTLIDAESNIQKIRQVFEESSDDYDGVLGFSQGSQAFQMTLWAQQLGIIDWPLLRNLKYFLNFSADSFRISLESLNNRRFKLPSLHFVSEEDFLFYKCILTPTLYNNPEVIFHTFGHRFPLLGLKQKKKMKDFIRLHGYGIPVPDSILQQSKL